MSLLQTWLYFGLLTDFLQEPIPPAAFSREIDATGRRVLCSSVLPQCCINWKQRTLALPFVTQIGQLEKAQLCLSKATLLSDRWDDHPKSEEDPVLTFISSVKVLIESLTTALHWVQKYHSSTFPSFMISMSLALASRKATSAPTKKRSPSLALHPPAAARSLRVSMLRAGWCPFRLKRLCLVANSSTLYYLMSLPPNMSPGISHRDCSGDRCTANTVNETSYMTRHANMGCTCQPVGTPNDEMLSIIREGGVPLISYLRVPSGRFQLRYVKASSTTRYTAISHVWSDGLGNPLSNTLPQCQLQSLTHNLETLQAIETGKLEQFFGPTTKTPTLFWMDTLCVPVGNRNVLLRNKAIGQMDRVFAASERMLVLDHELQQINHIATSNDQILANVLSSTTSEPKFMNLFPEYLDKICLSTMDSTFPARRKPSHLVARRLYFSESGKTRSVSSQHHTSPQFHYSYLVIGRSFSCIFHLTRAEYRGGKAKAGMYSLTVIICAPQQIQCLDTLI